MGSDPPTLACHPSRHPWRCSCACTVSFPAQSPVLRSFSIGASLPMPWRTPVRSCGGQWDEVYSFSTVGGGCPSFFLWVVPFHRDGNLQSPVVWAPLDSTYHQSFWFHWVDARPIPSPPLTPSLSSPVSKEDSHPSFSNPPPFRTVHDPPCKSFLNTPLSRSGRVRKGRRKQVQGDVQVSSATSTRLTANQTTRPCVEAVHGTRTNDTPKKREPEGKVDEKDSMKFGKLLRNTAEAQPEWADAYLDYKLLKKKLKALKRKDEDTGERRRKKKKKTRAKTENENVRVATFHRPRTKNRRHVRKTNTERCTCNERRGNRCVKT